MELVDELEKHFETLEARIEELERIGKEKDAIINKLQNRNEADFLLELHLKFILNLNKDKDTFDFVSTEHLRMQGVFWALCAIDILNHKEDMDLAEIIKFVLTCYNEKDGGFGGNVNHDSHILHTQHAIYVLALCDALDQLPNEDKTVNYIASRQNSDGSFTGDEFGEVDTRFTYCALISLKLLKQLSVINLPKAMDFVLTCQNFDGGFGCSPGVESHAGYTFTSLASLKIGNGLELLPTSKWDELGFWLSERQCDSGGLNGRPEKQADVCYSWWVLSCLNMLNKNDWIDEAKLTEFILMCQDPEKGGIADRPDNVGDVYHTFFATCGLSMLGYFKRHNIKYNEIDPIYALPKRLLKKLGII